MPIGKKEAPVWTPESIVVATRDWFKFLGRPEDNRNS